MEVVKNCRYAPKLGVQLGGPSKGFLVGLQPVCLAENEGLEVAIEVRQTISGNAKAIASRRLAPLYRGQWHFLIHPEMIAGVPSFVPRTTLLNPLFRLKLRQISRLWNPWRRGWDSNPR